MNLLFIEQLSSAPKGRIASRNAPNAVANAPKTNTRYVHICTLPFVYKTND